MRIAGIKSPRQVPDDSLFQAVSGSFKQAQHFLLTFSWHDMVGVTQYDQYDHMTNMANIGCLGQTTTAMTT